MYKRIGFVFFVFAISALSGARLFSAGTAQAACFCDISCTGWSCNSYDQCDPSWGLGGGYFNSAAGHELVPGADGVYRSLDGCGWLETALAGQCILDGGTCGPPDDAGECS